MTNAGAAKCPNSHDDGSRNGELDLVLGWGLLDFVDAARLVGQAQERDVVAVLSKICAEFLVFIRHAVMWQRADSQEGNHGAEDREAAGDPEGACVASSGVCATKVCDYRREYYAGA